MPIAFHLTISAFSFLYMLYSLRGFTFKDFLVDWILNQDGFRYFIIFAVNSFSIYCYVHNAFFGQSELTIQMYN
jgi:hypothetical protein